ncbi:D-alanyl-D-alanine carboxypeptidase (DacC) [Fructobacillus fructosus]|nr:D-alanyl-D-alanine carboxypeptidase (DacC) [Fructobacillus fructosus]CAK1232989.1 D-alanyl-D-alanine carboxypeptidase (DacC) [Fructobacillus fructosus]CAK1233163.1 D-alanyl-D-alanine carboxypeptidase (DacC) [Fructobacillus fructosus]
MHVKHPFERKTSFKMRFSSLHPHDKENKEQRRFWWRLLFSLLAVILLVIGCYAGLAYWNNRNQVVASGHKVDGSPVALKVNARSALVIDASTGQILGQKNANQKVGIASQSKMLTAYAVLQAIKKGDYDWNTPVKVTQSSDWSDKDNAMYAHLEVHNGETLTVKELFDAMFTTSANDASLALADFAKKKSETQQEFLQRWAKKLGLTNSDWYNAAGQVNDDAFDYRVKSASATAENQATPKDLAVLAYQIVSADPDVRKYYDKVGLVYRPNANEAATKIKLTEGGKFDQEIKGKLNNPNNLTVEGLKTGSTPSSGGGLTGLIKDQNGHEFITVVSGAGKYTDSKKRYQVTLDAVNQVLNEQQPITVAKNTKVSGQTKNAWSKTGRVQLVAKEARTYWVKRATKVSSLSFAHVARQNSQSLSDDETVRWLSPELKASYLPTVSKEVHDLPLTNQEMMEQTTRWGYYRHWLFNW